MRKKPIDLQAVRRADARLKKLLKEHPELREPNPERQAALGDWLKTHTEEKLTMPKPRGRPVLYDDETRPVTISVRLPHALYARLERYAKIYRQSITELVRDGLEWRLELDDPRSQVAALFTDEQTGLQDTLQQMIDARVHAALAAQRTALPPAPEPPVHAALEAPAPPPPRKRQRTHRSAPVG